MLERDIGVRLSVYGLSFIDSHGPRDLTMGDIASDFECPLKVISDTINSFTTVWLEGHSVERMYLRQRCSDGSVNKSIYKPRLTAAAGWQFSRRKIPRSTA